MKVGVDDFIVIRVMKNNNSSINPEIFHSKRVGQIPVTLSKVKTTASGTKFFNSYFGCTMVENPSGVKFKFDVKNSISIKDIKMKEGGNFVAVGSIKWISDVEVSAKNSKKLRECVLHDQSYSLHAPCVKKT